MRTIQEVSKLFAKRGYNLLSTTYKNNKEKLVFEKDGYKYYNSYNGFIKTDNFKKWSKDNPFSVDNLNLFLKKQNISTTSIISLEQKEKKLFVTCKCQCGKEYTVFLSSFLGKKQYQCAECGRHNSITKHIDYSYLKDIETNNLTLMGKYKGCKYLHYFLDENNYYVFITPYNLRKGADYKRSIFDKNNAYGLDNMKHYLELNCPHIQLLSTCFYGTKNVRYKFLCSCGNMFEMGWEYFRRNKEPKCPICSGLSSSLEIKTEKFLVKNEIKFERQKIFEECFYINKLKFDFYLPFYNVCIEIDGQHHFYPVTYGGISKEQAIINFNLQKEKDKIKNDFCKENNIILIRLPYWEFYGENYKNILKNIIKV